MERKNLLCGGSLVSNGAVLVERSELAELTETYTVSLSMATTPYPAVCASAAANKRHARLSRPDQPP